jgi:hypothetical protein
LSSNPNVTKVMMPQSMGYFGFTSIVRHMNNNIMNNIGKGPFIGMTSGTVNFNNLLFVDNNIPDVVCEQQCSFPIRFISFLLVPHVCQYH